MGERKEEGGSIQTTTPGFIPRPRRIDRQTEDGDGQRALGSGWQRLKSADRQRTSASSRDLRD